MTPEYKKAMKAELKPYDMSWKALILGKDSYYIGRYIKALRISQYCEMKHDIIHRIVGGINKRIIRHISHKIGFQFQPKNIGWGIKIFHWGAIVINGKAVIGDNICLYPGVCIGRTADDGVPSIGNNVTFFTNSAAYGGINIGNNVKIAPNAVVMHDVPDNCIVAGVPAKIIKHFQDEK